MNTNIDNPLCDELVIDTREIGTDFYEYTKNKKKYDSEGTVPILTIERADKVAIYTSRRNRLMLMQLSDSASKLLLWIIQSVEYGEDYIKFNTHNFIKETEMSVRTLTRAKRNLIDNKIIAKMEGKSSYYWINPTFLFKGSRVKKYPDNLSVYRSDSYVAMSDSKCTI